MILSNKKILVTGADGFIGSHLVEELIRQKCDVRAFVHYNSMNSWGWIDTFDDYLKSKIDIFVGDIRDPNGVHKAMEGCEVVFHLAALIAIPFSYHSPDAYVDTNIKGTLNILQSARKLNTKKIIITSTSEVYGTAKYTPIDEKHPLQGQSPYSATKIAADKLTESFYLSFKTPTVIVRPFNTYGPRQSARAIIPTIVTQLLQGVESIKLGNLSPKRDFNYIKDTINGFIQIAITDALIGQEVNIATGTEVSIGDIASIVIKLINPNSKIKEDSQRLRPELSEVNRLLGDSTKLQLSTGWKPLYNLENGLKETIEWFKNSENMKFYKPLIYNI